MPPKFAPAESLLIIINDLLDYSKIDAGKLDIQARPFSLELCVRSAVEVLSLAADSKQLTLTCQADEDVPGWVLGDDHRLRQVLVNLLGNAISSVPRAPSLSTSTERAKAT